MWCGVISQRKTSIMVAGCRCRRRTRCHSARRARRCATAARRPPAAPRPRARPPRRRRRPRATPPSTPTGRPPSPPSGRGMQPCSTTSSWQTSDSLLASQVIYLSYDLLEISIYLNNKNLFCFKI